jgi:hypothetical protein
MKKVSLSPDAKFKRALIEKVYLSSLTECGIDQDELLAMIVKSGSFGAAKSLLNKQPVQVGFRGLRRLKRLDLTVEHLVIQPEWRSFFSEKEISIATRRLGTKSASGSYKGHSCDASQGCPLSPHKPARSGRIRRPSSK